MTKGRKPIYPSGPAVKISVSLDRTIVDWLKTKGARKASQFINKTLEEKLMFDEEAKKSLLNKFMSQKIGNEFVV